MNWQQYQVTEKQFNNLVAHSEPISVPTGAVVDNAGVELWCKKGVLNAVYDANLGAIRKLNSSNPVFTDMPNRDLLLYNDHLLNENINTVVVDGFFGTGKTSTVCSHLVTGLMAEFYGRGGIAQAYLSKPHESLGGSYGHLPGTLEDKTAEEFTSFFQYFERFGQPHLADILMLRGETRNPKARKLLHVMVFEYLRGRDIDSGWVILDEAQNTSVKEMSAFISRIGEGAKVVVLGDTNPTQIDKRGNTPESNGLVFARDTFIGKKYAGYVEMQTIKHILRGRRVRDLFTALKAV